MHEAELERTDVDIIIAVSVKAVDENDRRHIGRRYQVLFVEAMRQEVSVLAESPSDSRRDFLNPGPLSLIETSVKPMNSIEV